MTVTHGSPRALALTALGWAATEPGANPPMVRLHRGLCPVCSHDGAVDKRGLMRGHRQRRVGPDGPYISRSNCPGKGQLPEATA